MSLDHVALLRLRSDLALRALSPAEREVVDELLVGVVLARDRRALDACYRLVDLGVAQGGGDRFHPTRLLLDLKSAGLLGELGIKP